MLDFLFNRRKNYKEVTIENKRFADFEFQIKGYTINILAEIFTQDSNYVFINKYRREIRINGDIINPRIPITIREYVDDLGKFIYLLDSRELNDKIYLDVLLLVCKSHVEKVGRIIDNDLEAYIDEVMAIVEAISLTIYKRSLKYNEGEELREILRKKAFNVFYNYLYINLYINEKPQLIKLSDYKSI